jgi:ERO1-like protein alpha
MGAAAGNGNGKPASPPRSPRAANGNGKGNGNGEAAGRRPVVVTRSGQGPAASATLTAFVLLTPLALVLLGLAAGDPRDNSIARRAEAALGAVAHARAAAVVRAAAPNLPPAAATLAAWAEGAWVGAKAAAAAARRGGKRSRRAPSSSSSSSSAPTCQLSGTVDAECCECCFLGVGLSSAIGAASAPASALALSISRLNLTSSFVPPPPILPRSTPHKTHQKPKTGQCTYADVQRLNEQHVAPLVSQLVKTAFFRYFKVNIACDCPLWPDDSMCALKACSVCQCGDDEVPAPWLAAEKKEKGSKRAAPGEGENGKGCSGASEPGCSTADCALEESGKVDTRLDDAVASRLRHLRGWRGVDNPWIFNATEHARTQRRHKARSGLPFGGGGGGGFGGGGGGGENQVTDEAEDHDEDDEEQYQYINLLANPERYTGYKGEHAHRIWAAIYGQSCFSSPGGPTLLKKELERCTEKRVFYRLISGMHASISAHLVGDWLLDEAKGEWGANLDEFRRRFVDEPDAAERVANLYFAYLFVLRAVTKAAPILADPGQYDTGNPKEDARARELVLGMFGEDGTAAALRGACPLPFDEGRLWRGEEGPELRRQLQSAFQNITRVMDCVGCEKCKLWGKLQTLGVATALKILFSEVDCKGNPGLQLRLAAIGGGEVGGAGGVVAGGGDPEAGGKAAAAAAAAVRADTDDDSSSDDYADEYEDEDEEEQEDGGKGKGKGGGGRKASAPPSMIARAPMTLERNEVIALINLLGRFSNSLRLYHELLRRVTEADSSVASDEETVLA